MKQGYRQDHRSDSLRKIVLNEENSSTCLLRKFLRTASALKATFLVFYARILKSISKFKVSKTPTQ